MGYVRGLRLLTTWLFVVFHTAQHYSVVPQALAKFSNIVYTKEKRRIETCKSQV